MSNDELATRIAKAVYGILPVDLGTKRAKGYAAIAASAVLPIVYETVGEAVLRTIEKARADERKEILDALIDGSPPQVQDGDTTEDVRSLTWDWARSVVRNHGKDGAQ